MPSIYSSCTEDSTKLQALKALREDLTAYIDTLRTSADQFRVNSSVYQDTNNAALIRSIDNLLASSPAALSAGSTLLTSGQYNNATPSSNLLTAIGLPTATSNEDIEDLLSSRHDLHVVEGKLIAPGDTDLVSAKTLYDRLNYSLTEWRGLLAGEHGLPFILVALQIKQSDPETGTACEPGQAGESETLVLGVNETLQSVAADNDLELTDLTPEVYWLTEVDSSPATVRLLKAYGLTTEQVGYALTEYTTDGFYTHVIEEPEEISALVGLNDSAMDRLLRRDRLDTINPFPETTDIVNAARERLTGAAFQDRDGDGIATMQPPGLLLAQVIDVSTFDDVVTLNSDEIIEPDYYDTGMEESLEMAAAAVQEAFGYLREAFNVFQDRINNGLGAILAPLTLVDNLFNNYGGQGTQLLQCLFGSGSVNLSLSREEIDDVIEQIDLAINPLTEIVQDLNTTFGTLGQPTCLVQTLVSSLTESAGGSGDLDCINLSDMYNFDIPTSLDEIDPDNWSDHELPEPSQTFMNLTSVTDLLSVMVRDSQTMVRDMITWVRNIAINLDLDFEQRSDSCNPSSVQGILDQLSIENIA